MQPGRARTSGFGVPLLPLARWVGWVAPVRPTHGVLVLSCPSAALRVCSVLGRWAPVHRCARAVCCGASAVSWASWLLFTGVLARCVVLHVRCPGPLGSCSPVCVLCAVRVCHGWLCPSSPPPNFRFFFLLVFCFFLFFLTRCQLEAEPNQTSSQRTDYSASATDRTASNTTRQRTPSLDRREYSQNTDYNHIPRCDTNDLNSPNNGSRKRAPDMHTPSPTHTVYSAQREETRHTQGQADCCPETAGATGPHGQREAGGQRAHGQPDPEQDPNPSQHIDYSDQTTYRTTNATPCRQTPSQDRTEYSARNTGHCNTPQHEAQHHSDRDNARGQNHKRSRRSRKQHSQARQRTTHRKHHHPYEVERLAPRWKPTPSCPPLPKPLTHPWNHCPVASTSPRTTTP